MTDVISIDSVKSRLITVRGQAALLDRDVAALYGVETKRLQEAVKNNSDKFPSGYVVLLDKDEVEVLRSKILTLERNPGKGHHSKHGYKAFTERGLYMLATILKSQRATGGTRYGLRLLRLRPQSGSRPRPPLPARKEAWHD